MINKQSKNKAIFWDYDLSKMDSDSPDFKIWLLNRKLQFGDLSEIKKIDLKKYLSRLSISPSLKELLQNFIQ